MKRDKQSYSKLLKIVVRLKVNVSLSLLKSVITKKNFKLNKVNQQLRKRHRIAHASP